MDREQALPADVSGVGRRSPPPVRSRLARLGDELMARRASGPRPESPVSPASNDLTGIESEHTLPVDDFLLHLHREQRRSERSNAALSVALFEHDGSETLTDAKLHGFVETLYRSKREADVLGHLGDGSIAVLCPDTSDEGVTGFIRKVDARAAELHFRVTAATFPDVLFQRIVDGTRHSPAFEPLLAHDGVGDYPLKRALDVIGALVSLLVFGLPMLVVAATVASTSPGPVIFRQIRLGRGGRPFTFYKFRSMRIDTDDGIHRHYVARLIAGEIAEEAGGKPAVYKMRSDPRVTRLGRFMRRTSIDELPQLFNVLAGHMSLVGPRPPIAYEAAHYQSWHLRRLLAMKPGMTGLWQVEGRSKVSFNEMVRMDLRYLRDCSLGLDLKILGRTVGVVLRCLGAS